MLVAFGTGRAAGAQSLVPAPPFSAAQAERLHSLRDIPVVVPALLPPGYQVAKVVVYHQTFSSHGSGTPRAQSYEIVYARGSATMEFHGANWQAGGDGAPDTFIARFHSALFGDGIVDLTDKGDVKCWSAWALDTGPRGTFPNFLMRLVDRDRRYFNSTAQGCDHAVSAGQFARIVESLHFYGR